jgi:small subunit ribosomal protein S14
VGVTRSREEEVAKKSKIARDEQRRVVVARHAERRTELKKIIASPHSTDEQRAAAQHELQKQPRDASKVRLRNRDAVDGRPRGYFRKFGLSRVRLREMAHAGELPGVTKSSW